MKTYDVHLTEIVTHIITLDANDAEEAEMIARRQWYDEGEDEFYSESQGLLSDSKSTYVFEVEE